MKIGQKIAEIRTNERNLSREYVAGKLNSSPKAYGNIENSITDISISRLEEIADILEVSPIYIMAYKETGSGFQNTFHNENGNKGTNIFHHFSPFSGS